MPNHLLLKRKPALPPGVFEPQDQYLKRRWRQVQYLADLEEMDARIFSLAPREAKVK